MRWGGVLLVGLLLAPSAGAWSQLRGEADRSTAIDPPEGVLDVVPLPGGLLGQQAGSYALFGRASPLAVAGPDGLQVLAGREGENQSTCGRFRLAPELGQVVFQSIPDCDRGRLQGHASAAGLLLSCESGAAAEAILSAYDGEGTRVWEVVPAQAFPLGVAGEDGLADDDWRWSCDGAALLDDHAVVPFLATRSGSDGSRHRIAKVRFADGGVEWASEVTVTSTPAQVPALLVQDANPSFLPMALTVSDAGVLVSGLLACPVPPQLPPGPGVPQSRLCRSPTGSSVGYVGAVAWLDADGTPRGLEVPRPPDQVYNDLGRALPPPMVSLAGAADGSLIYVQVGSRVLGIDPASERVEKTAEVGAFESSDDLGHWPIPLVQDHRLVVATDRRVTFLGPSLEPLGFWETGPTQRVVDLAGDSLGRLFILAIDLARPAGSDLSTAAWLTVLGRDGAVLHALPVPAATVLASDDVFQPDVDGVTLDGTFRWMRPPVFVEQGGDLAVVDAKGGLWWLRDVPVQPDLDVSDRYPAAGDQVRVTVTWPRPAQEVLVRWGDGTTEHIAWDGSGALALEHLYPLVARNELLVTVVGADHATATARVVLDVGGPEPPRTFMQKALARENADLTWGVLGLVLAALGAAWGFLRVRHGRWRLHRLLSDVQQARELGRKDPLGALARLKGVRQAVEDAARKGRLDQLHMQMVEQRIGSASRTLLHQSVAGFRRRLTPAYQGMLAGFFEDGRMGPAEQQAALDELRTQAKVSPDERQRLEAMFRVLSD